MGAPVTCANAAAANPGVDKYTFVDQNSCIREIEEGASVTSANAAGADSGIGNNAFVDQNSSA
ncbi:hypothetical protein WN943_022291 [Citrus x changshan-huyou]